MRAAVASRYGPPGVVRVADVAKPTPGDRELLVKVHATTVNRTDCAYRGGKPFFIRAFSGLTAPRVKILGTEFAGEVESVGRAMNSFRTGDRVFGYVEGPFGAHAQYLTVGAEAPIAVIPDGVGYEEAAPSTEGAHYALAFIRKARIGKQHDVLVYGASGGIGSAAVQLLRTTGATVTAVCGTEHVNAVRSLGPSRVVDYRTEDFTKDDQSYDVILDAVGKSTFGQCRPLLKRRGIYVSSELGPRAQNPFLVVVTPLLRGKRVLFAFPRQNPEMIRYFGSLLASGDFKPLVDRRYPLERIVEAYEYVESGQKLGHVVITMDHPT